MTPSRARHWLDQFRSYWIAPKSIANREITSLFGPGPVSAGVPVDEWKALNFSAFWAAVNVIAGDVASLPVQLFRRVDDRHERVTDGPLARMLGGAASPEASTVTVVETLVAHTLSWGNGYAEIERDGMGRVKHLWPLEPDGVRPDRQGGELIYRVRNPSGQETILPAADVIHLAGLAFDGLVGYSPALMARESLGLGLAAEKFSATFFGNGSTFGGFLSVPEAYSEERMNQIRTSVESKHQGPEKAHRLGVLWNGATYQRNGVDPNVAQLLETRKFQIEEVARWFNLPPHKIGSLERSTFANIEHQGAEYYRGTLLKWLRKLETELWRKCLTPAEQETHTIRFNADAILRADLKTRFESYAVAIDKGIYSRNEVRALENMNPMPDGQGEIFTVQAAQVDLKALMAAPAADVPDPMSTEPAPESEAVRQRRSSAYAEALSAAQSEQPRLTSALEAQIYRCVELAEQTPAVNVIWIRPETILRSSVGSGAYAHHPTRTIVVPPITSPERAATFLHELGHLRLGADRAEQSVIEREARAWQWASEHALCWDPACESSANVALMSFTLKAKAPEDVFGLALVDQFRSAQATGARSRVLTPAVIDATEVRSFVTCHGIVQCATRTCEQQAVEMVADKPLCKACAGDANLELFRADRRRHLKVASILDRSARMRQIEAEGKGRA